MNFSENQAILLAAYIIIKNLESPLIDFRFFPWIVVYWWKLGESIVAKIIFIALLFSIYQVSQIKRREFDSL